MQQTDIDHLNIKKFKKRKHTKLLTQKRWNPFDTYEP